MGSLRRWFGGRWWTLGNSDLHCLARIEREDFNATIAYGLGLPTEYEMYSPSGRPFRVAHKGIPVKAMFT